jgi:hypothetical protein
MIGETRVFSREKEAGGFICDLCPDSPVELKQRAHIFTKSTFKEETPPVKLQCPNRATSTNRNYGVNLITPNKPFA